MIDKSSVTISIVFLTFNTVQATEIDGNNSDIFVSYSGHNEAKDNEPVLIAKPEYVGNNKDSMPETHAPEATKFEQKPETEDIVFVPNDKPVFRNDNEYLENEPVKITDMMDGRKISDVINDNTSVTETANEEILFISGKNNENIDKDETRRHKGSLAKSKKSKDKDFKAKKLDCSKLDCDNTVSAVCGGKMDDNKWRYRLFLNECYFRKVNCAFKYPNNRYKVVTLDKCSHIGNHSKSRPNIQPYVIPVMSNIEESRRSFSSRRSLNTGINGQSCFHPCPVTCTERYEPQCAMSSTGQRHTFLNHCKLDYNSCLYNVAWYIRPLSECVGGKKADIQQNRGFIAWMQKVGIVDNRGRLTLSKGSHPR